MAADTPPEPTDLPLDHPLRQAWLLAFAPDDGGSHPTYGLSVANPGAFRGLSPSIILRPETPFEALVEEIIDQVEHELDSEGLVNRPKAFEAVASIIQRFADGR